MTSLVSISVKHFSNRLHMTLSQQQIHPMTKHTLLSTYRIYTTVFALTIALAWARHPKPSPAHPRNSSWTLVVLPKEASVDRPQTNAAPSQLPRAACTSDPDCYGGKCQAASGTCVCPPLWSGPNCQVLRLKPARPSAPGLLLPNTSTWGGTAVQGKDGQWHMIAARMEGHCGLRSWHSTINGVHVANSDIVHAAASAPDGPYRVVETVLPAFAHGPAATVMPDGRLVVAHLGCGNRTLPEVKGCTNGSTPGYNTPHAATPGYNAPHAVIRPPGLSNCDWPGWTGVLVHEGTSDWLSDWKQLVDWSSAGLVVHAGPDSWHNGDHNGSVHADNPSFWPLKNGSVLLAYATKLKHPVGRKYSGHKHIGLAMGRLPMSDGETLQPFRDVSPEPIFPYEAEDPTIFLDSTNNLTNMRWHILAHRLVSNISKEVCAHAVAASPFGPWKVATTPAYTKTIEWADDGTTGSTHLTVSEGRERPHMIIDRTGRPVALSNGVTPGNGATPVTPGGHTGDFTYTHVQVVDPLQ